MADKIRLELGESGVGRRIRCGPLIIFPRVGTDCTHGMEGCPVKQRRNDPSSTGGALQSHDLDQGHVQRDSPNKKKSPP